MGNFLQFKRLTSGTVKETFQVDGTATDLDSGNPTVTLTRPDGTAGPAAGTISHPATGTYSFVLAGQSELTIFDYKFVGTVGGQSQTLAGQIEIVGADIFTISDLRALRVAGSTPFSTTATPLFSNQQIMDARAATLDEFEQILAFSPVPRFRRETLDGDGSTCLELPGLHAHRVLSVTVNGVAQTASNYQVGRGNMLEAVTSYGTGTAFTVGRRNVVVEWVAGWTRVLGRGGNIAMIAAANILMPGFGSTARQVVTADGTSYDLGDPAGQVTASGRVREYGIPVIDAWLSRHAQPGAMAAR